MITDEELESARKTAERAVEGMSDGPLKIKAFEVILERILPEPLSMGTAGLESASSTGKSIRKIKEPAAAVPSRVPRTCTERVLSLRGEGFFDQPRGLSDIRDGLGDRGWVYPLTSLSGTVQGLVQKRALRRTLVREGKKKSYRYVNP
jgi:hypothetical protein